MSLNKK